MRISIENMTQVEVLPLILNRGDMMECKNFRYTEADKWKCVAGAESHMKKRSKPRKWFFNELLSWLLHKKHIPCFLCSNFCLKSEKHSRCILLLYSSLKSSGLLFIALVFLVSLKCSSVSFSTSFSSKTEAWWCGFDILLSVAFSKDRPIWWMVIQKYTTCWEYLTWFRNVI